MGTNSRGIDEQLRRWPASIGQGIKHAAPDAFSRPALEAAVERLSRAVDGKCVDPAATALDDVDDTADHTPVIYAWLAAGVGRQMQPQLRELSVRQPEMVSIHRSPPIGGGKSQRPARRNPFISLDPSE